MPIHRFSGRVFVGSQPVVPAGLLVEARIGGVNYTNSTDEGRNTVTATGGVYGEVRDFHICADVPETPEKEGGTNGESVEFFVEGIRAETQHIDTTVVGLVRFERVSSTVLNLFVDSLTLATTPAIESAAACTNQVPTPTPTASPTPEATATALPTPTSGEGGGSGAPPAPSGPIIIPGPSGSSGGADDEEPTPTQTPTPALPSAEQVLALPPAEAAALIVGLEIGEAAEVVEQLASAAAAEILGEVELPDVITILNALDFGTAARVLDELPPETIALVLQGVATSRIEELIAVMDRTALLNSLPLLPIAGLREISTDVLLRALRNVPSR